MRSTDCAETRNGSDFRIPSTGRQIFSGSILACQRWAVVNEDGNINTHNRNNAAHIEVHHEDSLILMCKEAFNYNRNMIVVI